MQNEEFQQGAPPMAGTKATSGKTQGARQAGRGSRAKASARTGAKRTTERDRMAEILAGAGYSDAEARRALSSSDPDVVLDAVYAADAVYPAQVADDLRRYELEKRPELEKDLLDDPRWYGYLPSEGRMVRCNMCYAIFPEARIAAGPDGEERCPRCKRAGYLSDMGAGVRAVGSASAKPKTKAAPKCSRKRCGSGSCRGGCAGCAKCKGARR